MRAVMTVNRDNPLAPFMSIFRVNRIGLANYCKKRACFDIEIFLSFIIICIK